MPNTAPRSDCPVARSLSVLGDRWSLLVIRDMMLFGKRTFNEFLESEEKIPTNTLATRLKQLEEAGLISKRAYQDNPPRFQYELTDAGAALAPVLRAFRDWCRDHYESTGNAASDRMSG
ncbi:MAG: helix-turn-helix transcriptional regulator [Aquisalinus sp.]|nr:helix-turn-helix transcriptional regulator [Aquisalinus sp.]